ncbi:MAG: sulfotransferase [Sphingobacteriales bacterium]|nr:sulfotransferase [Sphingobacteriales bacterium]
MPYYAPSHLNSVGVHFIIGSPRSGTTLLTSVLNATQTVLSTPEVRFTMAFYRPYGTQNPVKASFAQHFTTYTKLLFDRVKRHKKAQLQLTNFDQDVYLNFDAQKLNNLNYANLCKLLLLNIQLPNKDNSTVQTIVDKNPDYTFYVEALMKIYPDAKFVVALRDYRATVLSQKESVEQQSDLLQHAYLWDKMQGEVYRLLQLYPTKILPIKYEDTVQQTETTIKQVCSFLGIEFTPEMLNPQQKVKVQLDQTDISEREKKKIGDLQKPINTNRLEAWKTRLNTTELQLIETLCADTGKLFGYQPTQNLPNNSRLKLYLSHPLRLLRMAISFRLLNKYYFYLPFEWRIWLIKKIGLKR